MKTKEEIRSITGGLYKEFFKHELYPAFVEFLLQKLTPSKIIKITGDNPIINKYGVHYQFRRHYNKFLELNRDYELILSNNGNKHFGIRTICDGNLLPPIDCKDEELMVKEGIHNPKILLYDNSYKTKSPGEKEAIKIAKRTCKLSKEVKVYKNGNNISGTLVIHFHNESGSNYFPTTYRTECVISDIHEIISSRVSTIIDNFTTERNIVKIVYFKGKPYNYRSDTYSYKGNIK